MKKVVVLAVILALVTLGALSLIVGNRNSLKSRLGRLTIHDSLTSSSLAAAMPAQTITICKKTSPAGGTGFNFAHANGAGSLPSFNLNDGQCNTMNMTGQDHYNTFTENVPPGYTLSNISCTHTTTPIKIVGANSNPAFQPGDNTVTMDLNEANVTCTFTNQIPKCCYYQVDLSTGQSGPIDPLWRVNGGNAYVTPRVGSWIDLTPAKWLQPVPSPLPSSTVNYGTYKYTVRFNVPACPSGGVMLSGTFAADNSATALLDGVPIPGASCPGPVCFNTPQAPVPLNGAPSMGPGWHILEIDVQNASKSYSGLVVKAKATRRCP